MAQRELKVVRGVCEPTFGRSWGQLTCFEAVEGMFHVKHPHSPQPDLDPEGPGGK